MRRRHAKGSIWEIRSGSRTAGADSGHLLRGRPPVHLVAQLAAVAAAIALLVALFLTGEYPPAGTQASAAANLPSCATFGPEAAVAVWPNTWCLTEAGQAVYYELKQRDGDCIASRTMWISRFFDSQDVQVATRLDVEPWACVADALRWQDRS